MRELNEKETATVNGGYSLGQYTSSYLAANGLTFAGLSTILSLFLGKEIFIGGLLAEGLYGGTLYLAHQYGLISFKHSAKKPPIMVVNSR